MSRLTVRPTHDLEAYDYLALARDSAPPPVIEFERATLLLYESRWDRAAASLERWAGLSGFEAPRDARSIAEAACNSARGAEALAVLGASENSGAADRKDLVPLYALLGDRSAAIDGVERAYAARSPWAVWMGTIPWYDSLRAEPRFHAVLESARLTNGRRRRVRAPVRDDVPSHGFGGDPISRSRSGGATTARIASSKLRRRACGGLRRTSSLLPARWRYRRTLFRASDPPAVARSLRSGRGMRAGPLPCGNVGAMARGGAVPSRARSAARR